MTTNIVQEPLTLRQEREQAAQQALNPISFACFLAVDPDRAFAAFSSEVCPVSAFLSEALGYQWRAGYQHAFTTDALSEKYACIIMQEWVTGFINTIEARCARMLHTVSHLPCGTISAAECLLTLHEVVTRDDLIAWYQGEEVRVIQDCTARDLQFYPPSVAALHWMAEELAAEQGIAADAMTAFYGGGLLGTAQQTREDVQEARDRAASEDARAVYAAYLQSGF